MKRTARSRGGMNLFGSIGRNKGCDCNEKKQHIYEHSLYKEISINPVKESTFMISY